MRRSLRAGNADGQTPAHKPAPRGTRPVYRNARAASAARSPVEALESRTLFAGNGLAATYYDNIDFSGATASRIDARVNFDWAAGAPADTIGADTFSVRWSGSVEAATSETYTFHTVSDDGVRLWVDGKLLVDNWTNHSATENSGSLTLLGGQRYNVRMEFFENAGQAVAKLLWSTPTRAKEVIPQTYLYSSAPRSLLAGDGLAATYFNNGDLTGASVARTDARVDFDWGQSAPITTIGADTFSVRWTGSVEAASSESYTFHTVSDDGVRLWVDGKLLIDNWSNHSAKEDAGAITLRSGQRYDLRMEYFENTGRAVAKLLWSTPSRAKQVIPQTNLYSTAAPVTSTFVIGDPALATPLQVGWNLQQQGWAQFVQQQVQPLVAAGTRRIVLVAPFGRTPAQPAQFDSYLHATAVGQNWIANGFVDAWRPVTASGVEVVAQLGSITGDPDFPVGAPARWLGRFSESVSLPLAAGMSIHFGDAVGTPATSPTFHAGALLEALGVTWYANAGQPDAVAPPLPPSPANATGAARNLISAWSVGGTDDAGLPTIGWGIGSDGWTGFVRRNIQPEINWGARRFILFKPFGKTGTGFAQQFDGYPELVEAGRGALAADFVSAWLPLTQSGIEVISYLGKINVDSDFTNATPAAWLARFTESVRLPLEAKNTIGYDGSSHEMAASPVFRSAALLRALGVRVYVESRPHAEATGWFDYGVIATNQSWSRADPDRHDDTGPLARNVQLTGEIVRYIHQPPRPPETHWDNQEEWAPPIIESIVNDGHTAAFPLLGLIRAGVRLRDLT